jgi:hypoxanthine phosphoribosyltransferase
VTLKILFTAGDIAQRVEAVAGEILSSTETPDIAAPILAGAFVFAADLLRALNAGGLALPVEFLWLRSYGAARTGGAVRTLVGPSEAVRGKSVLLIEGVLDSGETIATAKALLLEQGARSVRAAVVVDKQLRGAKAKADFACFTGVKDFIAGYGMDDGGAHRGLPYIGVV